MVECSSGVGKCKALLECVERQLGVRWLNLEGKACRELWWLRRDQLDAEEAAVSVDSFTESEGMALRWGERGRAILGGEKKRGYGEAMTEAMGS